MTNIHGRVFSSFSQLLSKHAFRRLMKDQLILVISGRVVEWIYFVQLGLLGIGCLWLDKA
ncbi:hypothetical protein CP162_02400 [Corynebacterium pseudotuberculosis Cp162]|nr:hypothetical protein CP162_02400 [Corynebacterium pseudotuberculosis Cp162]